MASNPQDPVGVADLNTAVRLGKLESDVAHIDTNVGELRLDVRGLRDKVDQCALRSDLVDLGKKVDRQYYTLVFLILCGFAGTLTRLLL